MKYFPSFLIQAFIQAFRQAFIQSFIQGFLVMKIFRRRKVQLGKRPESRYFFFRTLKNRRAEELRGENGSFGTDFFRRLCHDRPFGLKTAKLLRSGEKSRPDDENFQEEERAS